MEMIGPRSSGYIFGGSSGYSFLFLFLFLFPPHEHVFLWSSTYLCVAFPPPPIYMNFLFYMVTNGYVFFP